MTSAAWIIGIAATCVILFVVWITRQERHEMATWDDSTDGWPDEESRGMD